MSIEYLKSVLTMMLLVSIYVLVSNKTIFYKYQNSMIAKLTRDSTLAIFLYVLKSVEIKDNISKG
jgi:hypothetical protein